MCLVAFCQLSINEYDDDDDDQTIARCQQSASRFRKLRCTFVFVDPVQTTVRRSVLQQRRRRMSAVHLAGSFIITWMQLALGGTGRRQHSSSVSMHALLIPAVWLLTGMIARNAGYTTGLVVVEGMMVPHILKSSDDVMNQVRDIITCFFLFH